MKKLVLLSSFILVILLGIAVGEGVGNAYGKSNEPKVLWKISLGYEISSYFVIDESNNIYVLNHTGLIKIAPEGKIVWNVTIYPRPYSGPVIHGDTIYVTAYVQPPPCDNTSYKRYLYAISADGHIKWKYEFQPSAWGGFSGLAVDKYGEIFVNSDDKYTYALYPNGTLKWKLKTNTWKGCAPAIGGNTLYVADKKLFAIDFNGTIKWTFEDGNDSGFTPTVGKDGTIYVNFDKMYAIYPNGTLKWKASIGGYSIPVVDDNNGRIYITKFGLLNGNYTVFLYALSVVDGHILWRTEIGGDDIPTPAIDENGNIYITNIYVNHSDYLLCIMPNGKVAWQFKLDGGGSILPPIIGKNDTVYVVAGKGTIYAIEGYGNEIKEKEEMDVQDIMIALVFSLGVVVSLAGVIRMIDRKMR